MSRQHAATAAAGAVVRGPLSRIEDTVYGLQWWKRVVDVLVSSLALLFCLPLVIAVAVVIKVTTWGPVLYKQERIGLNRRTSNRRNGGAMVTERRSGERRGGTGYGKPFTMYKFRTMNRMAENGVPKWSNPADPRVTPVGRILRKSRIDEIPQFVNVLRGEMSVVGPRPERAYFLSQVEREIPQFKLRLRTKPGITGLAQVEHGYTNSVKGLHDKLTFDLKYIDNLSLGTDVKILLRTLGVVVTGKGAY
jgi:lipopolysaccharide/colanic/teichoic acid biosynthesis glycosyltransferase